MTLFPYTTLFRSEDHEGLLPVRLRREEMLQEILHAAPAALHAASGGGGVGGGDQPLLVGVPAARRDDDPAPASGGSDADVEPLVGFAVHDDVAAGIGSDFMAQDAPRAVGGVGHDVEEGRRVAAPGTAVRGVGDALLEVGRASCRERVSYHV